MQEGLVCSSRQWWGVYDAAPIAFFTRIRRATDVIITFGESIVVRGCADAAVRQEFVSSVRSPSLPLPLLYHRTAWSRTWRAPPALFLGYDEGGRRSWTINTRKLASLPNATRKISNGERSAHMKSRERGCLRVVLDCTAIGAFQKVTTVEAADDCPSATMTRRMAVSV